MSDASFVQGYQLDLRATAGDRQSRHTGLQLESPRTRCTRVHDQPSVGLHDELALFVNSGFTPAEALQTATSNVAQYAGASREFGTLEAGKRADIVLLDANPLEDIRNTRKIHGVILGGRLFSRSELDEMVDRAVRGR